MTTRCEYCGQLFEGLSCPHCGAPRSDDVTPQCDGHCYSGNNVVINGNDNVVSITGDGISAFYADDEVYWTSVGVVPSEETGHVGMSERKRAKKLILSMLASIGFPLALTLLLVAFLLTLVLLIGYWG